MHACMHISGFEDRLQVSGMLRDADDAIFGDGVGRTDWEVNFERVCI